MHRFQIKRHLGFPEQRTVKDQEGGLAYYVVSQERV